MKTRFRKLARRQMEKKTEKLRPLTALSHPSKGWIKAMREALGMTVAQLGKRINTSQPRVSRMEKDEIRGAVTLQSMHRVAEAMDCRFVYAFVPRQKISALLSQRAMRIASNRIAEVSQTMSLEGQTISQAEAKRQIQEEAHRILEKDPKSLWGRS